MCELGVRLWAGSFKSMMGTTLRPEFYPYRKTGHGKEAEAGVCLLQMKRWTWGLRILPELTKVVSGERSPEIGRATRVVRYRDPAC